jgi:hypothetical protein
MAITLVSSVAASLGDNGGATSAIDTTGATLLAFSVSWFRGFGGSITLSDSKGNTYAPLADRRSGDVSHQWFLCLAPASVGAGHTFSVTGSGTGPVVAVYAFAGVGGFRQDTGATLASGTSLPTGLVTPNEAGALILTGVGARNAATDTVAPPGFTVASTLGSFSVQGSAAYFLQSTIAAINPTWNFAPAHSEIAAGTMVLQSSPPTPSALTVPQTAFAEGANPPVTFTTPPTVGQAIVVVALGQPSSAVTTITDTAGQTYTLAQTAVHGLGLRVEVWFCARITASASPYTVTATGLTGSRRVLALAIGGVGLGIAVDQSAGAFADGATAVVGPTAPLTANDVLIVAGGLLASSSGVFGIAPVPPPAWISRRKDTTYEVATRAATGQVGLQASASWPIGFNTSWVAAIVAFKSTGTSTVVVPDVKGKSQADAVAAIVAAGLAPGQVKKEHSTHVPPGHVIRTDPDADVVVPPATPVDLFVSDGAGGGVGPIGMLPGKVNAQNQLLVSSTVPASLSASLEGATAVTAAVLIPAPAPDRRLLVRRLSVSALAAGPFSASFASNGTRLLGPVWLTSGAAGLLTGRLFSTGRIARALPPGQGLTVTTSADAPYTIEADYEIVGV